MENSNDKIICATRKRLTSTQIVVESTITVDSEENLSKILAVKARANVFNRLTEIVGTDANVTGRVVIDLLYLTDGEMVGTNRSASDFTAKLQDEALTQNSRVFARSSVLDSAVQSVNGNTVKVATTVEVSGFMVENKEVPCLTGVGENMYAKTEEVVTEYLLTDLCDKFTEELTYTAKSGIKRVLLIEPEVAIKEQTPGYNFVTVSGEINTKILFVNNKETPELETITISDDFKQQIEINNVTENTKLELGAGVVDEEVTVTLTENDDGSTTIVVANPIEVCIRAYEERTDMCVCDLYSTKNEISTTTTSYTCQITKGYEYYENKIEGSVSLSDGDPRVDKYLASGGTNVALSNAYVQNGELVVEGIAKTNIIYLNDELGSIYSVDVEFPFVLNNKTDFPENSDVDVFVALKDVDVMVKKGRDVFFEAKAKVFATASQNTSGAVLAAVEEGDELLPKDSAIEIYFAKAGETIWDIAKELKVPEDLLTNQNPNVTDPLETDQSLAVYFQKTK